MNSENIEKYGNEPWIYSEKLVCFMDFLGFRERIRGLSSAEAHSVIIRLEKIVKNIVGPKVPQPEAAFGDDYKIQSGSFSDCMCFSISLSASNSEEKLKKILYFIDYISFVQANLVDLQLAVRGAVVTDLHYISENIIFSKALVKAYEAEQAEAVHPILLVDGTILTLIEEVEKTIQSQYAVDLLKELKKFIIKMSNGYSMIHYLGRWDDVLRSQGYPQGEISLLSFLGRHKKFVEEGIRKNLKSVHILQKYVWIGRYHNEFINTLGMKKEHQDGCLIPEAILKFSKSKLLLVNIKKGVKYFYFFLRSRSSFTIMWGKK